MVRHSAFILFFITNISPLIIPCFLQAKNKGIKIFSISYGEDEGFKAKVLYNYVYDEQAEKEKALKIEQLEQKTAQLRNDKSEVAQEILHCKQKKTEAEQLLKKTEENIKIQKAAINKALSKL